MKCAHVGKRSRNRTSITRPGAAAATFGQRSDVPQARQARIELQMNKPQAALQKQWSTWMKYEDVAVVPAHLAKKITADRKIDSQEIWKMSHRRQRLSRQNLGRDSPTCSSLLQNLLCFTATSRRMKLMTADTRGICSKEKSNVACTSACQKSESLQDIWT